MSLVSLRNYKQTTVDIAESQSDVLFSFWFSLELDMFFSKFNFLFICDEYIDKNVCQQNLIILLFL